MHLAFLYSRYPVISQTFCDTEMLALERRGWSFEIGSIHPPLTTLRHEHAARLQAPIYYAPPQEVLKIGERRAKKNGTWPIALVARHEQRYGPSAKAVLRARNAVYFAQLFVRHGVQHFHVHFANRAAQTALFVKAICGIPFSVTAHGQDFMVDLGSLELLREICAGAEFVAAETDFSAALLRERCPESAAKIHRVYNGMDLANFPAPTIDPISPNEPIRIRIRILSVGRLVEFKGFACLIEACAELLRRGCEFRCEIVGEGPLRESLLNQIEQLGLQDRVILSGARSQAEVFSRLRDAQIFALPSIVDQAGASDVFPTVILETMASSRPVVSTTVAGISESVINNQTGFLVPPNDSVALANALEKLIADPFLRNAFGIAGRQRVEENFQIETTVAALETLLNQASLGKKTVERAPSPKKICYLIDRWPDADLPDLETELEQLHRRGLAILPLVCRLSDSHRLDWPNEQFELDFLPDAIVLEAEWQQERALARELEAEHAAVLQRVPGAIFLEQARYALMLRKILARENISHLHATSSRALVGALLVKKVARASSLPTDDSASWKLALPPTISVAIERRPALPRTALKDALREVGGGRVFDSRLVRQTEGSFVIERPPNFLARLKLNRREKFWQEWSERLSEWSGQSLISA
ncbi:MAG TPA: glycosyltransferase family 4 protein [Chthoniobacterales bacterium]|jgi:glycosyltransferase involved in cell wall biosynthesis